MRVTTEAPRPMAQKTPSNTAELADRQWHISVERYFEISLLLMLGTAFATVATTHKLDFPSIVVVLAALLLRLWSYARGSEYSLQPRTVTRLTIFYIFFYGLDFLIFQPGPGLTDRMLGATVHLVLFATVVKVFSARANRDYVYLSTLSFLMMLASAVLTVGTVYLVCFTFYLLFSISTFISYEIKRSSQAARRAPEGPYEEPAKNRAAIENALATATAGLAAGIVALAAGLFFVIPRYRTGYLTALAMDRQNITGFSESVNLGDIRRILQSNAVVLRVIVEGDPREFQGIKWRGVALTSFDGKHWFNDNTEQTSLLPAASSLNPTQPRLFDLPEPDGWRNRPHKTLRYRVLLSSISTDVLFAASVSRQISGRMRFVNLDQTQSLHNPQHGYEPFGYEVVSDTGLPAPAALRKASTELPADFRMLYLSLPEKLNPEIEALAQKLTASASNNYDRAAALESYLRGHFGYSLNPAGIQPDDPIGSFLFKAKKGYCEYFAAAMVVMLRSINVPARLVNGLQTGSYNRLGGDFIVRARDAHSWVEVYFPQFGWVPFDPTPADPNPVVAGDWGVVENYIDAFNLFWGEWVINYDFVRQVELARQFENDTRRFQRDFQRRALRVKFQAIRVAFRVTDWLMSHKLLVLLFMLAVLFGLIAGDRNLSPSELRFMWAWRFRQDGAALGPREAAFTYHRFLNAMAKKGFRKSSSQTPREFALTFSGSPLGRAVREFTRLYNALRYGQAAVSLARLRRLLEEIGKG